MTAEQTKSRRRSPSADERQRDPERTKKRIRAAAMAEFADKGFSAANVSEIAARAGVNKQLISYYFGGKLGLYQELLSVWQDDEAQFAAPDVPLDEMVRNYVRQAARNRELGKLLLWDGLTNAAAESPITAEMQQNVAELRRRQSLGEFPDDLDPAHLLLALFAAANATIAFPHLVRAIFGEDPASLDFADRYAEQVGRLLRHLKID